MDIASEYFRKILKHWKAAFLSATALVAIVNSWTKFYQWLHLPWWAWAMIALASINVAQFLVWRDLRRLFMETLETTLARNKQILADQKETLEAIRRDAESMKSMNRKAPG